MNKYKTANGTIATEQELRDFYGAKFDDMLAKGLFTKVEDGAELKKKAEPILPMAPQESQIPSAIPGVQQQKPYTVSQPEDTSSELPSPQTDGTPITPSYVEQTPIQPEQGPLGAFNQKITGPDYDGQITPEEQARAVKIVQPTPNAKYKTANGTIATEKELKDYYGVKFDKMLSDGLFTKVEDEAKQEEEAPKKEKTTLESVGDWINNTAASLDRGFAQNLIGNPIKGLGTVIQRLNAKVTGTSGKEPVTDALINFGNYYNKLIEELAPQDEAYKNSLSDQFAQAFGQVASLIVTGGASKAAGTAGQSTSALQMAELAAQTAPKTAGAAATALETFGKQMSATTSVSAGLSMGQSEFERAKAAGATDDQAFEAFLKNASVGSILETIPVMGFLKRFDKATSGGIKNYFKTKAIGGAIGGTEELTTEVLQQLYSNKTAKDIYNINQDLLEGVGESGGIGFGVGFLLNAMGANAKILRKQGKETEAAVIEKQIQEFEQKPKGPAPSYKLNGIVISADIAPTLLDKMTGPELIKANIEINNDRELELKVQDKIVSHSIKEQVRQGNPELNEASLDAITQLEKELQKVEGNKTQTGKDKAAAIREQIKNIQENQIQEEAKVATIEAEAPEITAKRTDRIAELETTLSPENETEVPATEKTKLETELETLKTEQNAIQEQTTNEGLLRSKQPQVGLQEVGEGNVQPEVTATGTEKTVTPESGTQEVKEPSIVVHSTVNGFGLQHSEGINNENIVEPKDPRRFPETANPEERREFDKGNAVVTTDEVNDNGDKNISIISSTQDATGRAGGSVYDFMIPNGNTSNTENIKKIVTDVNKTDLKGKELINETIKQVKEYINSNKPSKEAVTPEIKEEIKPNWNYEGEGNAFGTSKKSRGQLAYIIRILDRFGIGNSYNRAEQIGELDTESPLTYEGDKERVSAMDGNGNTIGILKLQSDGGVEHIAVAPEFSRKGVASELIKFIEQKGAKINFEKSNKISPDAAKLFNKLIKETPVVSSKTQPKTIQQELASMETMFGEQITPTVKPTTDQGVSVTNKSAISDVKSKTKDKSRVSIIESAQKALKTLQSVLPNFDIVVHDNEGSYNASMSEVDGLQGSVGNFNYTKNEDGSYTGRIDINLSKANSRTVAHEVAHGIMLKTFGENPALFKTFRDRIASVLKESSNKELMDFAAQYEGDVAYEEYLVELTAALTQQGGKLSSTTLQKIAAIINGIVSKLTNGALKPFENIKETKQVMDFFNNISQSIRKGEEINADYFKELNGGGAVGTFKFGSKSSKDIKKAPSASDDSRSFIKDLVEDIDIKEFNGMPFVTNMYDYTTAGETDLGNGFKINMLGGKNYVPYMMSLKNKKIGDVSNLAAFNAKSSAESFIRNAKEGKASLFAPHSGTLDNSWQFQQHTFAELVNLILDKGIMSESELINTFNKTIESNSENIEEFKVFKDKYGKNIKNFSSFKSNPKKIVELLDIKNNYSPKLRKALNNAIAADKIFQKAIGVENKEEFFNRIMDPLNKGVEGGEIINVIKFDPNTFKIVETEPDAIDHHPSFGWSLLAKINGIYQPTDFYKSSDVTESYTSYNKSGPKTSRKAEEPKFQQKNVASQAGAIPKIAVFEEVKEMDKKFPVSKSQIDLYHGTPYEIKQFSTEKIGTGEGAQEFGWGLYFTTVKDIAKYYASAISEKQKSDKKFVYDVSIHEGKSPSEYSFLDWNQKVSEDVKNKIRKQAKKEGVLEEYSNKLGLKTSGIENIKNYVKRQFYVNKVIKLRESGISVSEAIKQVASDNNTTEKNIKDIFDLYSFKNIKGDYLYSGLSSELGSDKKASEFLLRAGIDGVKYPTSTISSVGVKSLKGSNYVVFDENAVTIKSVSKSQQDAVNVVNKIIKDARAQGFSEEAIKTFLEGKGMDPKDISEAMSAELTAAGKVSISEEMLPGYTSLMDKIDALIKNKTPLKDIVSILKNSKEYIKATDVQKEKLIRELRKKLGLKEKGAPSAGKILGEVKDVTKITMTEKQGLVKQIKDLARGAKSAKIAWMNISNLLTKEIKELESSGKVTAKQVSSIIRRFSSVNMFNEKSIEKFVGYMSNVFENAEYANKIDIARSLLTTAKKNIGTKIGIADGLILPLQRLFSINPNLIPESVLDKYLSLVDMFGKKQAVLSLSEKSEVIKTTQDILEAIDEEQSLVDELSDRFNASENKVLDEDGKLDYAASLKEMVKQEEITEEEADIMRKYKSDIVPKAEKTKMTEEEVAEEKKQLIDTLKQTEVNGKDLPTQDERKLAKQLKDLASTKAVEKLSNTELKNLLKVFDNINNNYLPHYAELMAEKLTAINDANSLTSAIKRAVVAPLSGIYSRIKAAIVRSGRTGIAEMVRRNPLFYVDQLFGDFKTKDIFNAVLNKVAEGESKFKSDLKTVQNILERAEERVAKSFGLNSNDTLMSKFKMMTYMVQLEHDSNQGSKQVNPAAEYLKATIKHIDEGKSQFGDRDANMLQQILKDFAPNGEIDNDKLYKSFNEAEKSAIKDIRGINESLKEKAEYTASIIRGDRINPLTNYVHLNVLHEHKPNDLTSGTAFVDDYNNSMKPSTKAKSLIERTGKVSPLNFDVFASAHKGAKFVLMDYNLTAPIRTARKTLKQTISNFEEEGRIPKEKRQIINAIDSAFEEATKNLLTNSFVTNSLADDFVNYINKQGYRAVLAGTSRFASELMSNIGFAVISDPKAFSTGVENKAFIMSADAPTFMKNVKSKETSRLFPTDTLSGKFIDTSILKQTSGISGGKSKNPVRNKIEQIWNLSGKKYVNSVELIADTLISTPDKLVMRPMWFGSFANEFKKITGENINFEKVSANDESYMSKHNEAIEKAKTTADERTVMTGATDNAFMGILKGTIKPDQSFTTRAFNNFNNFMTKFLIFEYVTARTGLMAAMGNGSLTKKQGAAVLAAVTTRMVVYTLLTQMLGTGLMGLIIGDDEEEEDEKSLMQKFGQALTSTFTSMIFGRDFGQATKAILNEGLERINENYLDFLREGDYDPYKDAIQYSIVPPEKKGKQRDLSDFLLNMGGAFGPALKTADFVTRKALEPEKQKEDAVERQENERSVRIPLEILGNLGLVPLYKDIRKAVLKDMYSSLETAEKTAANKKVIEQEKLHGYKNQSDMKRYDPELWDKTYGPNSTDYDKEQAIKEIKKAKQKLERETKDEMYNYVPKSSKAYKFGPQSSTGKSKSEYKFGPQSGTKKSEYKFGPK